MRTETFTRDAPTGASSPARTLRTTIFYPARGAAGSAPVPGAAVDRRAGPYPLVVFAHGLGASPGSYDALLRAWARAGYVVAAPKFPATSSETAGGVDPGDFVNQPADVSAVITGVQRLSASEDGAFAGSLDANAVGVAGHSLGGITTLGVAAHTCCRDSRIKAAVVLSGDPLTFPTGRFDYGNAPPILLVHGDADDLVPYDASIDVFNAVNGPKGLMTIRDGDHSAPVAPGRPSFAPVRKVTVDFFDAYLKGRTTALDHLEADGRSKSTRVVFVATRGTRTTVPTRPPVKRVLHATVTPATGLVSGQTVTVEWSGFTPGKTINIVQCSNHTAGDASACDLKHGKILHPDPTGSGSLPLEIVVGPVGNGACDASHSKCQIVFNDGGSLDPAASVRVSISFASS